MPGLAASGSSKEERPRKARLRNRKPGAANAGFREEVRAYGEAKLVIPIIGIGKRRSRGMSCLRAGRVFRGRRRLNSWAAAHNHAMNSARHPGNRGPIARVPSKWPCAARWLASLPRGQAGNFDMKIRKSSFTPCLRMHAVFAINHTDRKSHLSFCGAVPRVTLMTLRRSYAPRGCPTNRREGPESSHLATLPGRPAPSGRREARRFPGSRLVRSAQILGPSIGFVGSPDGGTSSGGAAALLPSCPGAGPAPAQSQRKEAGAAEAKP